MKIKVQDIPFTQVANSVIEDKKLSWKAKGIFAYIYSKPQDWDFSSERMFKDSSDGIKTLASGIRELEQNGYLKRKRLPDGKVEYYISYSKSLPAQTAESPNGRKPKSLPAQTGGINNKELNTNKETNTNIDIAPFSLKEEIKKLEESNRRDWNIIAMYFEHRKPQFENRQQYTIAFKMHLRDANLLKAFSDAQLLKALAAAKKDYSEIYTLRTLLKILTK